MEEAEAWKGVLESMKVACEISSCEGCKLKYDNGTCPAYHILGKIRRIEGNNSDDYFVNLMDFKRSQ
jgi:hypothetical protein